MLPVAGGTAVAFWGGMLKIVDADGNVKAQRMLPNDIGAMVVATATWSWAWPMGKRWPWT